jgi:SulP family sulfate permease
MDAAKSPESHLARLFGPWATRVSPATLRADLVAALPSAVLALPQGIAFATLAGLPAAYGLYSAVMLIHFQSWAI